MKIKSLNLSGKKGNAFIDTITVVIVIFVFGLISVLTFNILQDVNTDIQASDLNNVTKDKIQTLNDDYPSFMDSFFLVALIILWIGTLVASYLVDSNPVFLIITIFLIMFLLFFGGVLTNSWEELSSEDDIPASYFPITNWVLSNLVMVILVIGFSIAIVLYGKQAGGGI